MVDGVLRRRSVIDTAQVIAIRIQLLVELAVERRSDGPGVPVEPEPVDAGVGCAVDEPSIRLVVQDLQRFSFGAAGLHCIIVGRETLEQGHFIPLLRLLNAPQAHQQVETAYAGSAVQAIPQAVLAVV